MSKLLKLTVASVLILGMMGTVSASNNPDLELCYHFNESSGDAIDYCDNSDASNVNVQRGILGFSRSVGEWYDGLGYDFEGDNDDHLEVSNSPQPSTFTYVARVRAGDLSLGSKAFKYIIGNQQPNLAYSTNGYWQMQFYDGGSYTKVQVAESQSNVEGNNRTVIASYDSNNCAYIRVYKQNMDLVGQNSKCGISNSYLNTMAIGSNTKNSYGQNQWDGMIDEVVVDDRNWTVSEKETFAEYNVLNANNDDPVFDSVSTNPSSWTFGSDIDVAANVSDSDGSVSSVEADVWENGNQIKTGVNLELNGGNNIDYTSVSPYDTEVSDDFFVDNKEKGILKTVGFEPAVSDTYAVEIYDSQGLVASKSKSVSRNSWSEFSFDRNDYSRANSDYYGVDINGPYYADTRKSESTSLFDLPDTFNSEENYIPAEAGSSGSGRTIVEFQEIKDVDKELGTWIKKDLFTVDEKNVNYNYTLTATDDDGATATYDDSQFISDNAPSISISKLNNQSYFKYSNNATVSVSDSDDVPNEDINCDNSVDSSTYETKTIKQGNSFDTTAEADIGSHTFKASCSDPAGNTNNQTVDYSVDEYVFNSVSGSSSSFEKVNESYAVDSKVGSMVESVEYTLDYDSSFVDSKIVDYSGDDVLNSDVNNLLHITPFVSSDGTSKSYNVRANVSYSDFNASSNSSVVLTSSSNSQSIDQAYKFGNHSLKDGFTQLEGSTLDYTATIDNKTSNTLASVETVSTTYNQKGESKELNKDSSFSYSNFFNSDLISSSSESFNLDTTVKLVYNNDERSFSSSKQVTLDKINIEGSSTGSNEETLVFDTLNEVNESSVDSELNVGLYVWNSDQPDKTRSFNFESNGTSTHSFYIDPGYASVQAQSFKADDNETDWDTNYQNEDLNYPKRRYYFLNETLNNQTTNIDLYMIKSSKAQNIEFELLDDDLRALGGHVVRIERIFSGSGESRVVSMLRTGQQGKDTTYINPNEQYIFTVYNPEGELIQEIGPQSISGLSTTLEVDEEEQPNYANLINNVRFTDIQENNESLVVEYVSDTNKLNNISLSVYKQELFSKTRIDVDSSQNLQGKLKVSGFNASNESISYSLEGTFGSDKVTLRTGSYGEISQDYGNAGVFMSLLMFLALSITGLWRPSASIGLGIVGLFLMYFIGFISVSQTALISIAVLGALMIWRMS